MVVKIALKCGSTNLVAAQRSVVPEEDRRTVPFCHPACAIRNRSEISRAHRLARRPSSARPPRTPEILGNDQGADRRAHIAAARCDGLIDGKLQFVSVLGGRLRTRGHQAVPEAVPRVTGKTCSYFVLLKSMPFLPRRAAPDSPSCSPS